MNNWSVVENNFTYLLWGAYPQGPIGGLALTVYLAVIGIFFAFWLGLLLGLMRLSKRRVLRWTATVYIEVMRGVPLLMVLFWFYFLLPVLFEREMPEIGSAIVAFVMFTAAYIAEIVRAGVLSLPKGQMEAARSTGLSHVQAMSFVVLPQALRNMIPSFVNQFVSLTKDTSLAYVLGITELTRAATQVDNRTVTASAELYITIALMYFVICWALTAFSRRLEKRTARYKARAN